jgi:hypothetical protein
MVVKALSIGGAVAALVQLGAALARAEAGSQGIGAGFAGSFQDAAA